MWGVVKKMKTDKISKLQINMSSKALKELEDLQKSIDANTKTEVVKASLKLYSFVEKQKKDGSKILIKDKNGNEREIIF